MFAEPYLYANGEIGYKVLYILLNFHVFYFSYEYTFSYKAFATEVLGKNTTLKVLANTFVQ